MTADSLRADAADVDADVKISALADILAGLGESVHSETVPARSARYGALQTPLSPPVRAALAALGVERLYSHQSEAADALLSGRNVSVSTATASGKSLCYQLPALEWLARDPGSTALCVFPTKALAEDQLRSMRRTLAALSDAGGPDLIAEKYDGDTPKSDRPRIRREASVVLTTPDMLHLSLLSQNGAWRDFLSRLRLAVIDESHHYRGAMGNHMSLLMRRLRRVCAHWGASPVFAAASATVANPAEHAARLCGVPFDAVDRDGSPSGERRFIFLESEPSPNGTYNIAQQSAILTAMLVKEGIKTLTFCRTINMAERLANIASDILARGGRWDLAERVRAYRGSYGAEYRREAERGIADGSLRALAATNALEMGVDIGGLDAVVIAGYPGAVASAWQQAGRAGRGRGASIALLMLGGGPIDRYFARHPKAFFQSPVETANLNPEMKRR